MKVGVSKVLFHLFNLVGLGSPYLGVILTDLRHLSTSDCFVLEAVVPAEAVVIHVDVGLLSQRDLVRPGKHILFGWEAFHRFRKL